MPRRDDDEATKSWAPVATATPTAARAPDPGSTQPLGEASESDAEITLPPRFEPRGRIGRGGMGDVVRVLDRSLNREVAVKVIRSGDARARLRFLREARAAGTLRHPNIVTVHDVAPMGDYLVMELVEGESLSNRLRREGKLTVDEVRRIGAELLGALAAAHREGIIHRDVKPANILLDVTGRVKLTDFGIASFADSELTSTGQLIGTPAYMAPEQLRGRKVDARADVYSAGATLFELATGIRLNNKDEQVPDPRKAVLDATGDLALAGAIALAVREKEAERFPDAAAFAEALAVRAVPARRSWRAWYVVAAAVVGAGVIAGTAFALRGHGAAASQATPQVTTVALLPFENHVADPRLDFATTGFPHILDEQLGRIARLRVLGYFRVRGRVVGAENAGSLREAARSLGADVIVRGEIDPSTQGARVAVIVERVDGRQLERIEREAAIDRLPEAVQTVAATVAATAIGAPQELAAGPSRALELERELELGVAAFERQDFDTARRHLDTAIARDDRLAEAHYYLALLDWWGTGNPTPHIDRALLGALPQDDKDFLVGLRLLWDMEYPRGVDYFRDLAKRAPEHRDIRYGLFEAQFHGGYPSDAMATYRVLRDLAPRFQVGAEHAMMYYLARGDEAGIAWVHARWDVPPNERPIWDARLVMARRDYVEAARLLERAAEEDSSPRETIERELVAVYAVGGQLALAREADARLAEARGYRALADYGLAIAGGEDARGARGRAKQAVDYGIPGMKSWEGWLDLVALDLTSGDPAALREDMGERVVKGHNLGEDCGTLILAAALRDTATVRAATTSHFPLVAALARALAADAAGDAKTAAPAWRTVVDLDSDGRLRLLALFALARDLHATAEHAGMIAACDDVITPRVFTWAWGAEVGPCLRWSAEAEAALGQHDQARERWQRLLVLRARASADDELVRAARAALAK